jgi:hypothetical protein
MNVQVLSRTHANQIKLPINEHFFCVVREPDHQLRAVTTEALREFLEQFFLDRLLARLPVSSPSKLTVDGRLLLALTLAVCGHDCWAASEGGHESPRLHAEGLTPLLARDASCAARAVHDRAPICNAPLGRACRALGSRFSKR